MPPPRYPPVELPLLESACQMMQSSVYFAVRDPFLRASTQSSLARRALKAKSATNVRLVNGTYSSLFFDASAHTPLTPLIVEGDAQALLFTFQRVTSLLQRIQQLVGVFDPERETALSILQVFQACALELVQAVQHARTTVCKMPLLFCGSAPNTHLLLELRDWAVQLREMCAAAVERIHDRRSQRHMEQKEKRRRRKEDDEAEEKRKMTINKENQNENDGKTANEHPGDDEDNFDDDADDAEIQRQLEEEEALLIQEENELAVLEATRCQGLLFSDCTSFAPEEGVKDIAKAEKWLMQEEVKYVAFSLKEFIDRLTSKRSIGLLKSYGQVVEMPVPGASATMTSARAAASLPAMTASARRSGTRTGGGPHGGAASPSSLSSRGASPSPSLARSDRSAGAGGGDDDDQQSCSAAGTNNEAEDNETLLQLQLSLQRMQLFLGQKMTAATWLQEQQQFNQQLRGGGGGDDGDTAAAADSAVPPAIAARQHAILKQQSSKERVQSMGNLLPTHVSNSARFSTLSVTDRMEVLTTLRAIGTVFHGWKRWVRRRKEKNNKIDGVMRKNAVLHCLWRFRVWEKQTAESRAARRATYGKIDRGKRCDEYELSHRDMGVQHGQPQKTFFLRMGK